MGIKTHTRGDKGKVLLGLYGGFGFFLHVFYRVAECHIRKSAGMFIPYEFSLTEVIILGIPLSVLIGVLIYIITRYFEHGLVRFRNFGKNAISCGVSNTIIFFLTACVFSLLTIGAKPGGVIIPFVFGGILGVLSFSYIQFKEPFGKIENLKLEHEELRLVVRIFTEATVIFLTGAIIIIVISVWGGYFPDVPTHITQIFTLYTGITLYAVVGVLGVVAQMFIRMKKIRQEIGKLSK